MPCRAKCFTRSLELSRAHGSRTWELRTATDLAALRASQGHSDDARALLASVNNSIRFFESYADMGKLIDTAPGALVAFAAGGHDAAVADAGAGVVLFRDLTGSGASQVVAPPDADNSAFSALAFSADGKALLLASSAAQAVTQLDLAAGSRTRIPCNCSPTVLARMGSVFRLTELTAAPLWLLDAPESAPRIVFVPAYESLTAKE